MRHHSRAEYSNGDVEHCRIGDDLRRRNEPAQDAANWRMRENDLEQETDSDSRNESDDERLENPESLVLQIQNDENIECRDSDSHRDGNSKKKIERDRGSDDFSQIACGDCQLADDPEKPDYRRRVMVAARLREIASSDDPKFRREPLEQDRHQIRDEDYGEKRVSELRSAGEIRCPVAWVHVSDCDEVSGPGESEDFPPPRGARDWNRPVNFGERGCDAGSPPARFPLR